MRMPNEKRGFTLIELMVVLAIISILLTMIFNIWKSTVDAAALVNAKVKLRDESQIALQHMTGNLEMAGLRNGVFTNALHPNANENILKYDNGDLPANWPTWPPADEPGDEWSVPVSGISFVRPIADADGFPFDVDTAVAKWSDVVRFELDADDANKDGKTNQLIQFVNGVFTRILVEDVSLVVDNGQNSPFNTPASGGVAFRSRDDDSTQIWISLILRRSLGPNEPTIVSRYDDFVDVRN